MSFPPYSTTPTTLTNMAHYGSVGEHSCSSAGSASNSEHWTTVATSVNSSLDSNSLYNGQRQVEQLGAVISRYQYATAPSTGFGWSYGPGLDHLRFSTSAPEALVQLTSHPVYPQEQGSSEDKRPANAGQGIAWRPLPVKEEPQDFARMVPVPTEEKRAAGTGTGPAPAWRPISVKEEPEDLTGRAGNHGTPTIQTGTIDSDSESSSSGDQMLYIAEESGQNGERDRTGLSGAQKRKQKNPPLVVTVGSSVGMVGVHAPLAPVLDKRSPPPLPLPLSLSLPHPQNLPGPVRVLTAKDGAKMYSCPECNLFYADQLAFEVHLQAHGLSQGKRHVCKECGTSFRRREHLDAHMTAHSEDRPYSCETCGKAFKRNEHLTRHRVLHSGEKPHQCMDCGKAFYRKDHLSKHAHTHAVHRKLTMGEG